MRPCQTCQCFVPFAVEQCPRCGAALERIEEREEVPERHLMLVGASRNGHGLLDGARSPVSLPPIDGPAGRAKRPSLPKLPLPSAPDPLVFAAFLGVPVISMAEIPDPPATALGADTFSALLAVAPKEHAPSPPTPTRPTRAPATAAAIVATPVAKLVPLAVPVAIPVRRSRFSRRDPFTKRRTKRERLLARVCTVLAIALPLVVVVLRLPLGQRPELGAAVVREKIVVAPPVSSTPADDGLQLRTRADTRETLAATENVFPLFKTYAIATPVVLHRALPQFDFVSGQHVSGRVGEISLAGSQHSIVLAEFAGPFECLFARVVDHGPAEAAPGPSGGMCVASAAPATGWNPLGSD